MKLSMRFLGYIAIIIGCHACSSLQSDVQTAIAQTESANPTPTVIPTQSPQEAYCENFVETSKDLDPFLNSIADLVAVLVAESPTRALLTAGNMSWGEWLDMSVQGTGSIGSSGWRNHPEEVWRNSYNAIVGSSRQIEDKGIRIELSYS